MSVEMSLETLDDLLPLSLIVSVADGRIAHAGRLVRQIAPGTETLSLDDAVRVLRPATAPGAEGLSAMVGHRLTITLAREAGGAADADPTRLHAMVAPLEGGRLLLTCSFGPDVQRAVARHGLNAQDLAPIDPTAQMLFLVEARDAVLGEFGRMSDRLADALTMAEEMARTDKLTGLANRRALEHRMEELSVTRGAIFGVMHIDLDHFKEVNDTLGHAAGDHVLEVVARILSEEVRRGDLVSRVGGDEFVLIFPDCGDAEVLQIIGERIITRLEEPILFEDEPCRVSCSVGITLSSNYPDMDMARMLADADKALYVSKAGGRARVSLAEAC